MPRKKKNAATSTALSSENVISVAEVESVAVDAAPEMAPTSTAVEEIPPQIRDSNVLVALNRAQGVIFKLPNGKRVEIAGNAVHLKGAEIGTLPVGAFGLTTVKREDWEWIQKTYAKTALFKSGRIFAAENRAEALAEAAEKKDTRHGLEPVHSRQTVQDSAD